MEWSVVEAKSKLSELLKRALKEPQIIESRNEPVAVVLSIQEYQSIMRLINKPESPMARLFEASRNAREACGKTGLKLPRRTDRNIPAIGE
jgi:prevent-host-death family protein